MDKALMNARKLLNLLPDGTHKYEVEGTDNEMVVYRGVNWVATYFEGSWQVNEESMFNKFMALELEDD